MRQRRRRCSRGGVAHFCAAVRSVSGLPRLPARARASARRARAGEPEGEVEVGASARKVHEVGRAVVVRRGLAKRCDRGGCYTRAWAARRATPGAEAGVGAGVLRVHGAGLAVVARRG